MVIFLAIELLIILAGLFLMGAGLALLQTAANPYAAILGPPETAAKRISIMGVCNKFAGVLAPLAFGSVALKAADDIMHRLEDPALSLLAREELLDAMEHCYPELKLHSSPEKVLAYNPSEDRPQPLMDVLAGNGMTVTAGRLRPCGILDWKMTAFGHNTVRGAAGAAILNAELIVERGFLKK